MFIVSPVGLVFHPFFITASCCEVLIAVMPAKTENAFDIEIEINRFTLAGKSILLTFKTGETLDTAMVNNKGT